MDQGIAAPDVLSGATEIAKFLAEPIRRVHYLLERRQLPAYKIGTRWHMRRSTYHRFIEQLEAEAIERAKAISK